MIVNNYENLSQKGLQLKYLETNNLNKLSYITCFIQSKQHGSVWWFGPRPSASSVKINSPGLISRAATIYLNKYDVSLNESDTFGWVYIEI